MWPYVKFLFLLIIIGLLCCNPDNPYDPDNHYTDTLTGTIEFDFQLPQYNIPSEGIHRIDLSIAESSDDLYRGNFLVSINVSDRLATYTINLLPGDYYFQAGITCTCMGDTCLWAGFPGGRFGTKWDVNKITITKGEKLFKSIKFN